MNSNYWAYTVKWTFDIFLIYKNVKNSELREQKSTKLELYLDDNEI